MPLGVLKRSALTFSPSLPKDKQAAIHRLGYGVLNKCVLLFPFVFWDDTIDTFGHVDTSDDPSDRGLFYLFYQYSGLSGGALLGALVAGEGCRGGGVGVDILVSSQRKTAQTSEPGWAIEVMGYFCVRPTSTRGCQGCAARSA